MLIARLRKTGIVVALCLSGAALVACGDSGGDAAEDDRAAARANVDAMTREHAKDTTAASAAAELEPRRAVISETMPYAEDGDELVYGYFVAPEDMFEPLPAVIMIHEWWGLNDNIRAMADRLAAEGYIVLAVDLYGGKVAKNSAEARQLMLSVVEDTEAANENIRSAYKFVSETAGAPRVGSIGWCFGGSWSLNTAQLFPAELDASVIYYGQVTSDEDKLRPINSPILGFFGAEDTGIKVKSVEAFGDALKRLRKNHQIQIYPGVGHAFANPTGANYDEAAATDAWKRTLEFLDYHLSTDDS
ncbi:MAG: prolyl oligopeptidase family serine peptidase [Woeseiaceae bacterium]|nr:prolyl oligopeptidase family serine peptidase [Woeseiaceae bacterium]